MSDRHFLKDNKGFEWMYFFDPTVGGFVAMRHKRAKKPQRCARCFEYDPVPDKGRECWKCPVDRYVDSEWPIVLGEERVLTLLDLIEELGIYGARLTAGQITELVDDQVSHLSKEAQGVIDAFCANLIA